MNRGAKHIQRGKGSLRLYFLLLLLVLCLFAYYFIFGGPSKARKEFAWQEHKPWTSPPFTDSHNLWHPAWFLNESEVHRRVQNLYESKQRSMVIGFYHIATVGYYENVVKEQLSFLVHDDKRPELGYGMWDHFDYLFVGIYTNSTQKTDVNCGSPVTIECLIDTYFSDQTVRELLRHQKVILFGLPNSAHLYERPTLNLLFKVSSILTSLSSDDHVISYSHSKGVTWDFNDVNNPNTIYNWVQVTTYYTLGAGGKICASLLLDKKKEYNTCGTCFKNIDPFIMHYSGNMWMSRSSWIAKNRLISFDDQFCFYPEMCPCNGNISCTPQQEKSKIFDSELHYVSPEFWLFGSHGDFYNSKDLSTLKEISLGGLYWWWLWLFSNTRYIQLDYQKQSNICAIYNPPNGEEVYSSFIDKSWIRPELSQKNDKLNVFPLKFPSCKRDSSWYELF